MSSRLFVEVREKRGLAYYANSGLETYHDTGVFAATAGIDPKKLTEALLVIMAELNRLKNEPVTELELNRAKQNIKGRLSLRLEDSHSIARFLANQELEQGHFIQPEEYIAKIEKVSQSAIMEVANQFFIPEKRTLALVGPLEEKMEDELREIISK
jgi:predicted Zn-dependent peptidase